MNRIVKYIKGLGAFSVGVFVGVCYGSIVATLTTFAILNNL